ncbi:hypothetical protein D3C81_1879480 [compost metagenome]
MSSRVFISDKRHPSLLHFIRGIEESGTCLAAAFDDPRLHRLLIHSVERVLRLAELIWPLRPCSVEEDIHFEPFLVKLISIQQSVNSLPYILLIRLDNDHKFIGYCH